MVIGPGCDLAGRRATVRGNIAGTMPHRVEHLYRYLPMAITSE
jgi:hypothetical protein